MGQAKHPRTFLDNYEIRLSAEKLLAASGSPHDFVDVFDGEVIFDNGSVSCTAGTIRASIAHVEAAEEAGAGLFDVFDCHSDQLHECWCALFDPRTSQFRHGLQLEPFPRDVLLVDRIELQPSHRGRCLGLVVASKLIDMLSGGCGVAACKPFPLQFVGAEGTRGDTRTGAEPERAARDAAAATRRLRKHWSRLGFSRVRRSSIFALSLSLVRPKIHEILGYPPSHARHTKKQKRHALHS